MVTRDELYAAFMQTPRQADAARLLNVSGKVFRDNTRRHGIYVSRGDAWDADTKARMWNTPYVQRVVARLVGDTPDTPDTPDTK